MHEKYVRMFCATEQSHFGKSAADAAAFLISVITVRERPFIFG